MFSELDKKELDTVTQKAIDLLSSKEEIVKCFEKGNNKVDAEAWCGKYHIDLIITRGED